MDKKAERMKKANELLETIAAHGRKFFNYPERHGVSRFDVDGRGRVWFVDGWTGKRIYLHYKYWGKGFSEGGTLKSLVGALMQFIRDGELVSRSHFGPWPEWVCNGDLWGYGDDMQAVRERAEHLGAVARND